MVREEEWNAQTTRRNLIFHFVEAVERAILIGVVLSVLAEPQQFQQMKKEDLRALTPLIYSHVTAYGMFRLDLTERMRIEEVLSA